MSHYNDSTITSQASEHSLTGSAISASPAVQRRVAMLERNSERVIARAAQANVDITYMGIGPLFSQPLAYEGLGTDWVIGPAADRDDAVVPRAERQKLALLVHAGIQFPYIYIAHEVPKNRLALRGESGPAPSPGVVVSKSAAVEAVGPVPMPTGATNLANRLGRSSQQILAALGKALPIVGAIAAAPVVLVGAALGALSEGLDPVVFGVIPAGSPSDGEPAAWYILARWEWPAGNSN